MVIAASANSLLNEGEGLTKEQTAAVALLKRDVIALGSQADRLKERASNTPPGPKQNLLLSQEAEKRREILRAEGWNEAIDALPAIMFVANSNEEANDKLFKAAREFKDACEGYKGNE